MILSIRQISILCGFIIAALTSGNLSAQSNNPESRILLGIDVLERRGFDVLSGKKVGLLTHPAGVNRYGISTIDVLMNAPGVKLVSLFGPEHGLYGDEKATEPIEDRIDRRTGLPVYSLYGKYRRPTKEMLEHLDVFVIDLQDIGVRSYTYVSAMRYAMEECFKNNVHVVVLDRPNPLGGRKVDGPVLEQRWMSYVGAFKVPYVHGLTIGELAIMAKKIPGWMEIDSKIQSEGRLTVVPMHGWRRSMLWSKTGLNWVATSPAIPDLSAVLGYPMTGLGCQLGRFSHGYGTRYPFRLLQYPGKTPEQIAAFLQRLSIPGLGFKILVWKNEKGEERRGVYITVTDWEKLRPTELSFYLMRQACVWEPNPFTKAHGTNSAVLFNKHVGSTSWWNALRLQGNRADIASYLLKWSREAQEFQDKSKAYWLYQ